MSRIIRTIILGICGLAACIAQTRDRRLEDAQADIAVLKRLVKEQDRRIADLEKALKAQQAPAVVAIPGPPPREDHPRLVKPLTAKWMNPLAWARIQEGLSRAQVEEILGKLATVESVIDYQTLIYKGDASSASGLAGSVKLTDDRVSQVIPPAF